MDADYQRQIEQLQRRIDELELQADYDEMTGLLNNRGFLKQAEALLKNAEAGEYAFLLFDVSRFKAINDMFGREKGDYILRYLAQLLRSEQRAGELSCRFVADRFVMLARRQGAELQELVDDILAKLNGHDLPVEFVCNMGIYVTTAEKLNVRAMIDRAVLAQRVVKGSYTQKYYYYTEDLRRDLLDEQEIVGMMATELDRGDFVAYYQPQYNHANGLLVGAEALARWQHPQKGMISPGVFIPIFEKNGFITRLDFYIFEETCRFLRRCLDKGLRVVPISTNFSRYDIYQPDFVERLEELRARYDIPVEYLRVEITETAFMGTGERANAVLGRLHERGYITEMDDFGSGYSSLNVLRNINMNVIKLDMLFLREMSGANDTAADAKEKNKKGGTIISSVVRMAKWLSLPVIAEGVETAAQADYLRSIGCEIIQGFLYSRPVPADEFEKLLAQVCVPVATQDADAQKAVQACALERPAGDTRDVGAFWDAQASVSVLFDKYMGAAAVFEYQDEQPEILRVNRKYLAEIGMNMTETDLIRANPWSLLDEENREVYRKTLAKVIATGEEQECETWRTLRSASCGCEQMCIASRIQLIGRSGDTYLFFASVRNVSHAKEADAAAVREKRFMAAAEQANIYFWEFDLLTKEMRPCFRCMRDLGLPPLMTNYPDSVIEAGVIPQDYGDMYRDWCRQLAAGVPKLEGIIPLTAARIPFHVRYTTEFDSTGLAVKAYGSATLVVE